MALGSRWTERRIVAFLACWLIGSAAVAQDEPRLTREQLERSSAQEVVALLGGLTEPLQPAELAILRQYDRDAGLRTPTEVSDLVLQQLARAGDQQSRDYLRQVFETYPARRAGVARAISGDALRGRRLMDDWNLLVRSLPILEGNAAGDVLRALRMYRVKSTRAEWQRQVILLALRNAAEQNEANLLLEQWTGRSVAGDSSAARLAAWQAWFRAEYPDSPPPEWPSDAPSARHRYQDLAEFLKSPEARQASTERGAKVFQKAQCARCHRVSEVGERVGPDLTRAATRYEEKELLRAILFPAFIIPDEYLTRTVVTRQGKRFTGMVHEEGQVLTVLPLSGNKEIIERRDVASIELARGSAMPDSLLETLTREEIADLFAFLLGPRT